MANLCSKLPPLGLCNGLYGIMHTTGILVPEFDQYFMKVKRVLSDKIHMHTQVFF